jgi:hypothetical protein
LPVFLLRFTARSSCPRNNQLQGRNPKEQNKGTKLTTERHQQVDETQVRRGQNQKRKKLTGNESNPGNETNQGTKPIRGRNQLGDETNKGTKQIRGRNQLGNNTDYRTEPIRVQKPPGGKNN